MQHLTCTVLSNQVIAEGCHLMTFACPQGAQPPQAGQFMTLRVGHGISPLLRRPFAYSSFDPKENTGSLIYERRGNATNLLAAYEAGDFLDLIGPLGTTFPLPQAGTRAILVAGGIGIGPMLFLHQAMEAAGHHPMLVVGARSVNRLPLDLLPAGSTICTDDGSGGFHGTVLGWLQDNLRDDYARTACYACGPHGMMKALAGWTAGTDDRIAIPTWVSLEQTMACAVGACMGCVVKTHHEKQYSRVCTDGPVYQAEWIDWDV